MFILYLFKIIPLKKVSLFTQAVIGIFLFKNKLYHKNLKPQNIFNDFRIKRFKQLDRIQIS